jgi:hypothetical protein
MANWYIMSFAIVFAAAALAGAIVAIVFYVMDTKPVSSIKSNSSSKPVLSSSLALPATGFTPDEILFPDENRNIEDETNDEDEEEELKIYDLSTPQRFVTV